jgi:hypothetical protein
VYTEIKAVLQKLGYAKTAPDPQWCQVACWKLLKLSIKWVFSIRGFL